MTEKNFDLIIIGAGPGGYVAAIKAAKAGMNTAVIENRRAGGTCLNRGCIPAKAMIHASSLYREAKEGDRFGVNASDVSFDYEKILQYKEETIEDLVTGVEQLLKANGVTQITGRGELRPARDGLNVVSVTGAGADAGADPAEGADADAGADPAGASAVQTYTADKVILAAGSEPIRLPIDGADSPRVITSDELFALKEPPKSLIIIGGGVIGVEFASVFSNLGTEVTILEALPKILDNFDKEISRNLQMIMKKRGVDIHTAAMVKSFEDAPASAEAGAIRCLYEEKGKLCEATAEYALMATGRRPKTEGLFGDGVEVEMNGKFVAVDENFETNMKGVYAIGDLIGGMQLAHAASAHGLQVIENITGEAPSQKIDIIPGGVYTDPEIASVGITEAQAKDEGLEVKIGKFIMSANGKSLITKEERGFIKVVVDESTEKVLGAQMICARATDMIGEFTTAIANDMTAHDMLRSVRAHPTYNEAIAEALEDAVGESTHTMPRRR